MLGELTRRVVMPAHSDGSPRWRDVHGFGPRSWWIAGMAKDTVIYLVMMIGVFVLGVAAIAAVVALLVLAGMVISAVLG